MPSPPASSPSKDVPVPEESQAAGTPPAGTPPYTASERLALEVQILTKAEAPNGRLPEADTQPADAPPSS